MASMEDTFNPPTIASNLGLDPSLNAFENAARSLAESFVGDAPGQPAGQRTRGIDTLPAAMSEMGGAPSGAAARALVNEHAAAFRAAGAEVGYGNPLVPLPAEVRDLLPRDVPMLEQVVGSANDGFMRPPFHSRTVLLDASAYVNNSIFGNVTPKYSILSGLPCFIAVETQGADARYKTEHVRDISSMNSALRGFVFRKHGAGTDWFETVENSFGLLMRGMGALGLNEAAAAAWVGTLGASQRMPANVALSGAQWALLGVPMRVLSEGTQPAGMFATGGPVEMACIWPAGDAARGTVHPGPGTTLWLVLSMRYRLPNSVANEQDAAEAQRAFTEATGQVQQPLESEEPNAEFYLRWEPVVTAGPDLPLHHVSGPHTTMLYALRVGTVMENVNSPAVLNTYRSFIQAMLYPSNASSEAIMTLAESSRVPRLTVMLETAYNGIGEVQPLREVCAEVEAALRGVVSGSAIPAGLIVPSLFDPARVNSETIGAAYGTVSIMRTALSAL